MSSSILRSKKPFLSFATFCLAIVACIQLVEAAGPIESEFDTQFQTNLMAKAKDKLNSKQYQEAIAYLKQVIEREPNNADAWNLTGFAERKRGFLTLSAAAYTRALNINPSHKGALAYQAELFSTIGQYHAMRNNREKLAKLCPNGCQELSDLDAFIRDGTSKAYSR